jgi:hypothetical protein
VFLQGGNVSPMPNLKLQGQATSVRPAPCSNLSSMGDPTSSYAAASTAFESLMHASSHTQPKFAFNKMEVPVGKPITTWHTILSYHQDGCLCIPVSFFHIFTVCQSTSYFFGLHGFTHNTIKIYHMKTEYFLGNYRYYFTNT